MKLLDKYLLELVKEDLSSSAADFEERKAAVNEAIREIEENHPHLLNAQVDPWFDTP